MGAKGTGMAVVEVMKAFAVADREIRPGARLLGWESAQGWRITFNGAEIAVPPGTVGAIDSQEVKVAAEKRSAREEEYQSAPLGKSVS